MLCVKNGLRIKPLFQDIKILFKVFNFLLCLFFNVYLSAEVM